jgi:hypothetical protein
LIEIPAEAVPSRVRVVLAETSANHYAMALLIASALELFDLMIEVHNLYVILELVDASIV